MDNNIAIAQMDGLATIVQSPISVTRIADHMELVSEVDQPQDVNAMTITLVNTAISNHVQITATTEDLAMLWANAIATTVSLLNSFSYLLDIGIRDKPII